MKRIRAMVFGLSLLGLGIACRRPAPSSPTPPPVPSPTEVSTPSTLECPSFSAFGGLPIPLPAPVPLPGADVRGSPSPSSDLARRMDQILRQAFSGSGLADPRRSCFFEVRAEGKTSVLGIYEFPSPPGADAGDRLKEALERQGVEAESMALTSPGGAMVWIGLKYPEGQVGGLLLMERMGWGWIMPAEAVPASPEAPEATEAIVPTPTAGPTEAPPTVQPTGLAQEVDAVLRPALERALEVRLRMTDFMVLSMGETTQVNLTYAPEAAISLSGRGERLREELGRIGLSEISTVESPGGIVVSMNKGTVAGRSLQTGAGMIIHPNGVEVYLTLR